MARALAWHARGHRFDPDILHHSEVDLSSSVRKEIFDILTHKTVSKDFVQVKKENKSQKTAESMSISAIFRVWCEIRRKRVRASGGCLGSRRR